MSGVDDAFFREWDARAPGERRSLVRARALRAAAGLAEHPPDLVTVVGSKGKGTAAVYASATLAAAGRRVVTLTSPSLVRANERIRFGGAAVDDATLAALGGRLDALRTGLPPRTSGEGYLSPSGLFLLAALLHARDAGADALVLEAGRGGRSDEVSLVDPAVVAVTPIFAEHLAELGGSVEAVVTDKCGVVRPATRAVMTAPQEPATADLIRDRVVAESAGRLAALPVVGPVPGVPDELLPPGLGRANARLGCAAALALLAAAGGARPDPATLAAVLGSVRLPGRLSRHRVPGSGTEVLLDAAVGATGFAAAIAYATETLGTIDRVLLSLPDDKDLAGAEARLRGLPVTFVPVPGSHLRFTRPLPPEWTVVPSGRVDREFLAASGARLLALGTVSFAGHLLSVLDVDPGTAFRLPPS